MKKVLFINSTPKLVENSNTLKMAHEFLNSYKEENKDAQVTTLNLYEEDIKFLDLETLNKMFGPEKEELTMMKYAKQFADADVYVIAAPMWNLSFPAILKAYFDYVSIAGVTFKYTPQGAVGLLNDKKAIFVSSRGGKYDEGMGANFEMGERYVRAILGFFGVSEISTISMELASVLQGEDFKNAFNISLTKAKELGKVL